MRCQQRTGLSTPKRSYFEFLKSKKGTDTTLASRVEIIRMIDRGLCGEKKEKGDDKSHNGKNLVEKVYSGTPSGILMLIGRRP